MSLFKAREWWSTKCGSGIDEEFVKGSLAIGNVDNEGNDRQKIVTGSLSGYLRIYYPRTAEYKIEDLMLEQQLGEPIIQVEVGNFALGESNNSIAVLHPRKLSVYFISSVGGSDGGDVNFYKLNLVYEHELGDDGLHFTAANMCYGPFGGVYGKDYICVQSMDGKLSFFEQDHLAFTRQLDCLLPGPMMYLPKTDSIITCSSKMCVESYKYHVIAAANRTDQQKGNSKVSKLELDWSCNIGEHAVDVFSARFCQSLGSNQVDIVVLGEHTLFCLTENGSIRLQKRFDYNPSSIVKYSRGERNGGRSNENLIVSTHTKELMIYQDTRLIWSARLTMSPPIELVVSRFGSIPGLITALDETGKLLVMYLGTDPPTNKVSSVEIKELNYESMDEEHQSLLNVIRESQSDTRVEPKDKILLRAQVPNTVDKSEGDASRYDEDTSNLAVADDGSIVETTFKLFVSYTGMEKISNVTINLDVPNSYYVDEKSIVIYELGGGSTPLILPIKVSSKNTFCPSSLDITAAAAYTTENGEPRTASIVIRLPLSAACKVIPAVKASAFKLTLDTIGEPLALTSLFEEAFSQPGLNDDTVARITSSMANVLSFQYYNGATTTILVSKAAGRYRVQSSSLDALWIVVEELVKRLENHFGASEDGEPSPVSYSEPLPLADFFTCIDDHFEYRKHLATLSEVLNDRAHQFRIIQKRLLVRFKDRNPAPLNNLDTIMSGTFNQLVDIGNQVEKIQSDLKESAGRLSSSVRLMLLLMKYRFNLDEKNYEVLESHLTPIIDDTPEQGWEERVDAAMTHLLRTSLAKNAKESASVAQPLAAMVDTNKLKKHITIVCDRLEKGASLYIPPRQKSKKKKNSSEVESKNAE